MKPWCTIFSMIRPFAEYLSYEAMPFVCSCSPLINMGATKRPYGDRVVMIGDSGVTRLYKDGIGAAYRTAKAAASTAVFQGVSAESFEKNYWPACKAISSDNAIGKVIFGATTLFKHSKISRRAILRMTTLEQEEEKSPHMSSVLWNMFTGSAPYKEIFMSTLHPGFLGKLLSLESRTMESGRRLEM